jgi:hypothetical protein
MSQNENKQFRRNYKYNHLDADELRKRREDNTIMLRKQKRDEQVYFFFNFSSAYMYWLSSIETRSTFN